EPEPIAGGQPAAEPEPTPAEPEPGDPEPTPAEPEPMEPEPGEPEPGEPEPAEPEPAEPEPGEPEPGEPEPGEPEPPAPCPPDVVCVDALPYTHRASTDDAPHDAFDTYGCAPDVDESGAERLYRIDLPEAGFLAIDLVDLPEGVDVDVHLLNSRDADDCVDRGHWRAGGLLPAGQYWVAVDTWVSEDGEALAGDYTLRMALTTPATLEAFGVMPAPADDAIRAFGAAWAQELTDRFEFAVIDFSLHSSERREWIVDLVTGDLLFNIFVAHGDASANPEDLGTAVRFSNVPQTHQSSLGLLRTGETYSGDFGYSHRLDGLEPGYNDNVRRRDIVMHPSAGSRDTYVDEHGMALPTWGCPAIDDRISTAVVDTMAGGALMFFWYPDGDWRANSSFLR
ncbi:MAG: hypothetical protein ACI9U2_003800, partial [Bradymonadia bacterium]